jgi:anhydro-N-acetylmuramic acid kinase
MLIDRAAAILFNENCDLDGKIAAGGKINQDWLGRLKSEKYYCLPPPKTTGRELFGYSYADRLCQDALSQGLSPADIVATLTALTAVTVAESYASFVSTNVKIEELILGGGGANNKHMRELLVKFWPHKLKLLDHEDFGLSSKFKESLLFALLAYTSYFQVSNNVPVCTGAVKQVCLGSLFPARLEI